MKYPIGSFDGIYRELDSKKTMFYRSISIDTSIHCLEFKTLDGKMWSLTKDLGVKKISKMHERGEFHDWITMSPNTCRGIWSGRLASNWEPYVYDENTHDWEEIV